VDVYWLGGGSGAGKSTVARRIAREHGLQLYDTDAAMTAHAQRADPARSPALAAFVDMDMDERWLNRSPVTMLESFHWFRGEGFELILDDLAALRPTPPVVAEGFRLLPSLVKPHAATPNRAVWLLPTPAFRAMAFARRGATPADHTSDPDRALRNVLERDRLFTERLEREAADLELPAIRVDVGMTEDDVTEQVRAAFAL
jgi:2-phosphoglycerate kinase